MAQLIWTAPMAYWSPRDETAFFNWLQSIPGVTDVRGQGRELFIRMKSKRLSQANLLELLALYRRYDGCMPELAQFANDTNRHWFQHPDAWWYKSVFEAGQHQSALASECIATS
jgi:hypothetical protein